MLVKWKNGEKYNSITMNDVEKLDDYELNSIINVKFNSKNYKAYIKFIGIEEQCLQREEEIIKYLPDQTLKQTIAKKPTGRILAASINNNQEVCHQQQLESENQDLHKKLKLRDEEITFIKSQLKKEQDEHNQLKINSEQFKNAANGEMLHSIAITLFNFLAKPTDIAQLNIIEHTYEKLNKYRRSIYYLFFIHLQYLLKVKNKI